VAPPAPDRPGDEPGALAGRADYPLYVVTASHGEDLGGCLAGFVTQCSIRPLRYLVCISKQNRTFHLAEAARFLALHLLGRDQTEAARWFGEATGDQVDKLGPVAWHGGPDGVPVLDHCAAWVAGPVLDRHPVGDHEAFVLAAVHGGPGDHEGVLLFRSAPPLNPGHPVEA
jgi:flavin reductase (DIM6/NTAB) family NADH-FMN oxidoreductase RutF